MKVLYKSRKCGKYFRETTVVICCDGMKEAWEEKAVFFGEYGEYGFNTNKSVNIAKCSPYPEGAVFNEYPINYCPFCGKKIEIEEEC